MELEFGLKITRTKEDVSSSIDFRFSKDSFGPLVLSRETESRFIIIIHLKGFKKEGIEIEINEEGDRITIRGRKPVEEMVLIRWMVWRKEVEVRAFKKVFLIPNIVDLDKIKARFDDDDSTLTITMPKRVKGISGFKIEEEEEERRVSTVENIEEIENGEGVEEENVEREKSEDKERERHVLEEETEDKTQQIDEQDKSLEFVEEETISSKQELPDSNKESEDKSLRKLPDINQEVTKQQDSQEEHISDDMVSRSVEEIEEQEPDETDGTNKSGAREKKTINGDGSSKVRGRHNKESKIEDIVEAKKREEKKKIVKMEEVDGTMGEGFTSNISETETKAEGLEFDKREADEVDKIYELVEKKEGEDKNSKVGEQEFQGKKRYDKQEKIKELVEVKTLEAETHIARETPKPVQEIEVPHVVQEAETNTLERCEGNHKEKVVDDISRRVGDIQQRERSNEETKIQEMVEERSEDENKKIAMMEIKNEKTREGLDNRRQQVGEHDIVETDEAKSEKIDEMKVDEEEENNNVGQKSEEKHSSLKKSKEFESDKVQADEGERKNQQEDYDKKNTETTKKTTYAGSRKVQEIIRQQELDEPARCEKENKTQESVNSKTINEEKEEKATEAESDRPKVLEKQEKIHKENYNFSRKVKEEKEEEFCEGGDIERRYSDAMKRQGEKDKIQELVPEEKVSGHEKGIIAVAETITENVKSRKVQEIDEQQSQEIDKRGKQFKKLIEGETSGHRRKDEENEKNTIETEERIINSASEAQDIEKKDLYISTKYRKEEIIQELQEEKKDEPGMIRGTLEQELVNLNSQLEQDDVDEEQEKTQDKPKDCKKEESETKTDDVARKVQGNKENELYEPKRDHVSKVKEMVAEKEIEAEYGGLNKVHGSEEQKLHEPKIHKERDKSRITKVEEPSGQKKEEEKIVESLVQDKIDGMEENEIVERRKKMKDCSLRKVQDDEDNSGKLHEFEERKSYEDWTHEERATNPKDQHSGGEGHEEEQKEAKVISKEENNTKEDSSKKVQEIAKEEYDVQDKMQETQEKEKSGAMEENKILKRETKAIDDFKDKYTGQKEKERHEKVLQTKTKVEDEINKNLGERKELRKLEGVLREVESDRQKEEEKLVGGFTTKIQDIEKEESREVDRNKKLDVVHYFVRNETENLEDEKPEEAADEMAKNEKASSRKLQTLNEQYKLLKTSDTGVKDKDEDKVETPAAEMANNEKDSSRKLQENGEHTEQYKILKTSDTGVKEEDEDRVDEKDIKEQEAHVQKLEGNCKHEEGRRGVKGKQKEIVETKSGDRIQETIAQESNKKKDQEARDKIEELERQQLVKLVMEDDSFSKGQELLEKVSNVSKRLPVEQENFQELEEVKKRKDEEEAVAETKIKEGDSRKPELLAMQGLDEPEEKTNAPEKVKVNKKNIEEEMHDKTQEPTKDHKEEEKEEMKRIAADVSSRMVQKMKAQESDGSEKHHKPSEIQEKHNIKESVEDMNEVFKEDSRKYQGVEEKHSDQEQEKHQELVEIETNDQSKEDKTKVDYEEGRSDKREKINRKEGTEAVCGKEETKARDDGYRKIKEIEEQELAVTYKEHEKKQELLKKDTSGQAKVNKDQETKNADDSSKNVKEDEKQETGEQDKTRKPVHQKTNNRKYEETANKETKTKGSELRKKLENKEHETSEQIRLEGQEISKHMRLEEQERMQKLLQDGNSKKIQEIEKEPGRDQEPVVLETSEDEEEELEIEYEESEEDWEAEVIHEMDSDEDNDEIRQIKRIQLGFRLVGGSTLFMSLIVIVISFIRSQ